MSDAMVRAIPYLSTLPPLFYECHTCSCQLAEGEGVLIHRKWYCQDCAEITEHMTESE